MGLSVTVNQKHGPIFFSSYLEIEPPILNHKKFKILERKKKESGTKRNHQRLKYK